MACEIGSASHVMRHARHDLFEMALNLNKILWNHFEVIGIGLSLTFQRLQFNIIETNSKLALFHLIILIFSSHSILFYKKGFMSMKHEVDCIIL
jgi:hypothetical protein